MTRNVTLRGIRGWFVQTFTRFGVLDTWRAALPSCGLREIAGTRLPFPNLVAKADGVLVVFSTPSRDMDKGLTEVAFSVSGSASFSLELARETWQSEREKRGGTKEVEVGEPAFDDTFYLRGDPGRVLAALDVSTRREIATFADAMSLVMSSREMVIFLDWAQEESLNEWLPRPFDLAKRLAIDTRVLERLAHNATGDPVSGVRLRNVIALRDRFADAPEARAALRAASHDAVPEVRLHAAEALGAEGAPVLEQLAEAPDVPDACSASAVRLSPMLATSRLLALLAAAVPLGRTETAIACIDSLATAALPEVRTALSAVLATESGRLSICAARALGAVVSPTAERALVGALESGDLDTRLAACESLGRIGSVDSVLPLRESASLHGGRKFHAAIRQAIAEIQSRRLGAEHGQLSIAAPASGALSLTDEAGRLSLADQGGAGTSSSSNARASGPK